VTFTSERHPGTPAINIRTGPKSGPVLLFLHGLGRFSEDYLSLATDLVPHFQSVIIDFRGHGDSEWAGGRYFVADYVNDTVELIRSRFAEPILVYGHSLGAMVALAAATLIPEHIRGMILEEPPFHTMGRRIHHTLWLPLFTGMQKVSRDGGSLEEMARALGEVSFPAREGNGLTRLREVRSSEALRFGAKCLSKIDPAVFDAPIQGCWLDGYDERDLFAKVACPSLLLQGDSEAGGAFTDEDAELAESLMPGCERIRFRDTGHLIRSQRPLEVMEAVLAFAAKLPMRVPGKNDFTRAADAACLGEQPIRNPNSQSNLPHV
jgi:pimeloyl-ACP methyl ester carboxylesterase